MVLIVRFSLKHIFTLCMEHQKNQKVNVNNKKNLRRYLITKTFVE
jgi:hypothetical protein